MSIEKHEFADFMAELEAEAKDDVVILRSHGNWIFLDKEDVEALAMHFGLISES